VACGVILAGGRGERFGGPKAFAALPDGRTFLAACRDVLLAAGCAPLVATLPAGTPLPDLAGVRALPLPVPDLAMFDSLKVALGAALAEEHWDVAVVLPVDHPLTAPETVRTLCERCVRVTVPRYRGKRGHPVALARSLASSIAADEHVAAATLRDVLHAVGIEDVDVDDPGVTANCNTPAALVAAWERRQTREEE
jgi:molybdenum cofactor cytidylyltransferase